MNQAEQPEQPEQPEQEEEREGGRDWAASSGSIFVRGGGARKPVPPVAPGEPRTLVLQTIVSLWLVWWGGGFCRVVEAVVWVGCGGSG